MISSRIEARAVFKVVAIVLVSIGVALLLEHVIVEVRTTIRWLLAANLPRPGAEPRSSTWSSGRGCAAARCRAGWRSSSPTCSSSLAFGFIVLNVIPPIVREVEQLGSQLPSYVNDFEALGGEQPAVRGPQRQVRHHQDCSPRRHRSFPPSLGDAAGAAKDVTVGVLNNLVEAIVVLTLSFFLLLDGGHQFDRAVSRLGSAAPRARA